jgi:class 3 adenylate cyclase
MRKQKLLDRILTFLFPTLGIPRPEWLTIWQQSEFKAFTAGARAICVAWAVIYGVHYWLVDIPAQKEHLELWAMQRALTAGSNFAVLALTFTRVYRDSKFYRLPLLIVTAITINQQAQAMAWRTDVPFFYVPLQAFLGITLMRLSPIVSILLLPLVLAAGKEAFFVRPGQNHHMVSASIVVAMLLYVVRSRMKTDLRAFVAEQVTLESQKNLIAAQQALVDQLRRFLPREIYRRVQTLATDRGWTALQASDEILRPRSSLAAILHSDIRGFTRLTNGTDFRQIVSRAQQLGTEAVEKFRGIPRLHGDLIYSYFDLETPVASIVHAIRAAFELSEETNRLNAGIGEDMRVRRFVIISFGLVQVGNIGGSEGAREITVIGPAANLPSRIDSITKEPKIQMNLAGDPVVLTQEAFAALTAVYPNISYSELDLRSRGIGLRDFPSEQTLFLIPTNDENWKILGQSPDSDRGMKYFDAHYIEKVPVEAKRAA